MATRDEIQSLARENEQLEDKLQSTVQERDSERTHKRRVERIMARAAESLRSALRVSNDWQFNNESST